MHVRMQYIFDPGSRKEKHQLIGAAAGMLLIYVINNI